MSKQNVTSFYNEQAVEYDRSFYTEAGEYSPLLERQRLILELLDTETFSETPSVLDIGCGPGEMLMDLAGRGFRVWGIDISKEMIQQARTHVGDARDTIELGVGDIEQLHFDDNSFDVVIAAGVVEYLESDTYWIKEVSRVLKPNGILILNVTNRYAIRRLTLSLVDVLKRNTILRSSMNFIKQSLLRKGPMNYFPFQHRVHGPSKFDAFLKLHDFQKMDHRYFDLTLFPYPLDTVFSYALHTTRVFFTRYASGNLVLFGCGYIVKARKRT